MRKLIFLLFLCSSGFLLAQTPESFSCGTVEEPNNAVLFSPFNTNTPNYSGSVDPAVLASYPQISFDIYFWILRRGNGTGDYNITEEILLENVKRVNELFKPMGICFVFKGYGYFDSDLHYYEALYYPMLTSADSSGHFKQDAFNVYLPKTLFNGNGQASTGENMLSVEQTSTLGLYGTVKGNNLAHELAHNFGLSHVFGIYGALYTNENTTRDPNDPNYNALTTADRVHDTAAMGPFFTEAKQLHNDDITAIIDADCNYSGIMTDGLGAPLTVTPYDVGNIMGYTRASCVHGFTTGQGIRIREYIEGFPNITAVQIMRSDVPALDLYIKDSPEDFGEEPNVSTSIFHNSSDIWIRNQPDNIEEHQNPEYDATNPNYVYVRITNRGCDTSTGTEELKVYWTKSATALSWDYNWVGNHYPNNGPVMGDLIGTVTIPILESGEQAILQLPWDVPNPTTYNGISAQPWHFCLLARIEALGDPMTTPETTAITYNVSQNNNITGKNLTVIDLQPDMAGRPIGGAVAIGNPFTGTKRYNLVFRANASETGKRIYDEAEVTVELDPVLLNAWEEGGEMATNINVERGKMIIKDDEAVLENIVLDEDEFGILYLQFNFLTQEITEKDRYIYNVIQMDEATAAIIGGETYEIRKQPRSLFFANAGDHVEVDKNEAVVLSAELINEPAIYNWYDSQGNLIYEGADFAVSTEVVKKYKLEVIALADGYKDYAEVELNLKPNAIETISPNPSSGQIEVQYKVNSGDSAYLAITGFYGSNTSDNYIVDVDENVINIDVSAFPQGLYTVALIVNGEISDTKILIKQ